MPRPLRVRYKVSSPSELRKKIEPVLGIVRSLEGVRPSDFPIDKSKESKVIEAFDRLRGKIGPTCASKVLHILQPELFVPWDNDIRQKLFQLWQGNGADYLRFLQICKSEVDAAASQIKEGQEALRGMFYEGGWKPLTKLLDEARWAQVKHLKPHFPCTTIHPDRESAGATSGGFLSIGKKVG
jgi:hypothetical protein